MGEVLDRDHGPLEGLEEVRGDRGVGRQNYARFKAGPEAGPPLGLNEKGSA